jgi:hypothetical protein
MSKIVNLPPTHRKVSAISPNYYVMVEYPDKFLKIREINKNQFDILEILDDGFDSKVKVYEDRVKGWFLDIATELDEKNKHAGFIVLMLCVAYMEGNQQFREGRASTAKETGLFIKRSLGRMFKIDEQIEPAINLFVKSVRHGLFHDNITKKEVLISNTLPAAIILEKGGKLLLINPHLLLNIIRRDFENYIFQLKDKKNEDMIKRFENFWKTSYE